MDKREFEQEYLGVWPQVERREEALKKAKEREQSFMKKSDDTDLIKRMGADLFKATGVPSDLLKGR
jgi:hypothetical protein